MGTGRSYLAAFTSVHTLANVDERRQVTRQGLAMLAEIAEREPAPLEGLPADQLLLAVRVALADGMLGDLDWLSPASAAIAMFELAQALPAGAERRELGRRVLTRLREADRDTFVRLLTALARTSPKIVAGESLRARLEVVLAAPFTAPGMIGELAIGLLAQPALRAGSKCRQPARCQAGASPPDCSRTARVKPFAARTAVTAVVCACSRARGFARHSPDCSAIAKRWSGDLLRSRAAFSRTSTLRSPMISIASSGRRRRTPSSVAHLPRRRQRSSEAAVRGGGQRFSSSAP
jgi:hypothetical protein